MPPRDQLRPPVSKQSSWQSFHAMWPASIVRQLRHQLPPGYVAEPRVHRGTLREIAGGALASSAVARAGAASGNGGEYEVRTFDPEQERKWVAAIAPASPVNNDRAEARQAFVAKCAALLRKGVAVSIVDRATLRRFNLYAGFMEFVGHPDQAMSNEEPPIYAAS